MQTQQLADKAAQPARDPNDTASVLIEVVALLLLEVHLARNYSLLASILFLLCTANLGVRTTASGIHVSRVGSCTKPGNRGAAANATGEEGDGREGKEDVFHGCYRWAGESWLPDPEGGAVLGHVGGVVAGGHLRGLRTAHPLLVIHITAFLLDAVGVLAIGLGLGGVHGKVAGIGAVTGLGTTGEEAARKGGKDEEGSFHVSIVGG